ncbi:cellulose synthase operon protein YhjQ/BcsQ [Vibrio nomapromontoriensis]|uniref:cellulose synthase operon protein YhjQ/BcsQ n=1 Tax=Vibrio nomapromontoriensis TaxID=2910246 RepID=UPI003D13CBC5
MSVISVQAINNGAGASTIAANMAAAYSERGHKVLLIELDTRNLIGCWFGQNALDSDGWTRAYISGESWNQGLFKSPAGTYFLPYGDAALDIEIATNVLKEMLQAASLKFEHIIVLLPSDLNIEDYGVVCDLAIKVVNPTPVSVMMLSRWLQNNESKSNVRFVMNLCRHDVRLCLDLTLVLEEMLGDRLFSSYVYFDIAIQEAFAELSNVMVSALYAQSHTEFKQLATVTLSYLEQVQRQEK